jgi:hypothetical protein
LQDGNADVFRLAGWHGGAGNLAGWWLVHRSPGAGDA